ncbi:hypothetical protein COS31_03710 [Candidatus Roizmanbacteria bacterium CG02_land_8_20_14_3_00_36_15]|uniref:Transglutaminase-like domain-containing protein n=1 Tax=Candidatus Roizmanbacteria bacterium CG10_big_fil_rev_8_21_14_0_10_36_26 TaxID=1974851 RepID=A0A2M8KMG0_9BACT|nr:MAG: hypothetical protein COS51_00155 [Candidatus Roizmanbacteria bacterium CG03_land_8_20_14_0_80_36_21]PIV37667.1 MAG: hypothetical protein COS31_03710 [Candidatus Roizmanbacteria bacterium CG02_land_8_20_14_3_00_36_15]PIY69797.1 MAG: hypothetical protein COY89_04535 [Candidatus Roizmanbacteria bacterium CG_4_10_14_0_8_um_filter_36_36]PJA53497.1 MAG: hypothetical protein CO166_01780 [Candidatus Roizmanbacteria bacterium CG_4_9_14_3_um_filter_36_11]PJE61107.1 MAG: hypothetical protein COU86
MVLINIHYWLLNIALKSVKKLIIFLVLITLLLIKPNFTKAADFTTDYQVEYTLQNNNQTITSDVKFNIKITHQRSDIFVKKFFLQFPKIFAIKNVTAGDDKGSINPTISQDEQNIKIEVELNDPNTGKGSENNIYINFNQENLFIVNGSVWEVILPTIENRKDGKYSIVVNLPENTDKKISIAKPIPNHISGRQLIWNDVKTKTVYAVFGDKQFYQTNLTYNINNPKLFPVYSDIALPPDSLYQQVFFENIDPQPDKIYIDDDGNYMARYNLSPMSKKTISFNGVITVFSKPRSEFQKIIKAQVDKQKKYLLTARDYWYIDQLDKFSQLNSASDIYFYVVNNLSYDYSRLSSGLGRIGADKILKMTNKAVCTDFTDLFVALAREKGIYSREIEGYGFSSDPLLRPLSFRTDVLHSWPEYFDTKQSLWVSLDPTWENTSGIDYFSSFDLNHIVFAIHGKSSVYPYPAGAYKTEESKSILINSTDKPPSITKKLIVDITGLKKIIYDKINYEIFLNVSNQGNVTVYNQKVMLVAPFMLFKPKDIIIAQIAPLEERSYEIKLNSLSLLSKQKVTLTVLGDSNKELYQQTLILYPYYYQLAYQYGLFILAIMVFILIFIYAKKRVNK